MLDRRRKGGLGRLISAMSDNPGQTVTTYAGSVGVSNRQIQKWKNKISVSFTVGRDPATGRAGCRLWQLSGKKRSK